MCSTLTTSSRNVPRLLVYKVLLVHWARKDVASKILTQQCLWTYDELALAQADIRVSVLIYVPSVHGRDIAFCHRPYLVLH